MAIDGTIAINAAIVGQQPTGLGFYALHLISGLAALGERLVVFTSRPDLIAGPGTLVQRVSPAMRPERGAWGHLRRLLWVQTGLRVRVGPLVGEVTSASAERLGLERGQVVVASFKATGARLVPLRDA